MHDKDTEETNNILIEVTSAYDELNQLFDKLSKGMDEEQTSKVLDDKYKKFKTSFYDFNTKLIELENRSKQYSKINPEILLGLNNNFILSMQTFERGGTFSEREKDFYEEKIKNFNQDNIIKDMLERKLNAIKFTSVRTSANALLDKIEKKYATSNENIMAKDAVGKKFGAPKRIANDILINLKMKCSQAQDGLDSLLKELQEIIFSYNKNETDSIIKK